MHGDARRPSSRLADTVKLCLMISACLYEVEVYLPSADAQHRLPVMVRGQLLLLPAAAVACCC